LSTQVWLGFPNTPPPGVPFDSIAEAGFSASSITVLVVDDEPLIADTIAAILVEHGFFSQAAYGAEEAIRIAENLRPDIVLTDVMMPKMSGIQMAIEIKTALPETRIVLLSGQAATAEMVRHAAADGHEFELLAKPIHPEELITKLKENP
jgi:CheY-like chemotaxis protein